MRIDFFEGREEIARVRMRRLGALGVGLAALVPLVAKYLVLNGGWASPSKDIFGHVLDEC